MPKRIPINLSYEKDVGGGSTDEQSTDVIPDKEIWFISKIALAHAANGGGFSGDLIVDYGANGVFESLCRAFLTGDTREYTVNRDFVGDAKAFFRTTMRNLDPALSATMFITIKGYKKLE